MECRQVPIRYSLTECPLGRLLVAWTDRGVCAVSVAEADETLEATLRETYPSAAWRREDVVSNGAAAILARLHGEPLPEDLPVDVHGTEFQRRVWDELRRIPCGETRTYSDVAHAIGKPGAARAVANACAANPIPLVVPCHRVIRADGELGGYGLGLARKAALLRQERAPESAIPMA